MEEVDVHQLYKCMRCGECRFVCPVFETERWDTFVSRGRMIALRGLVEGKIKPNKRLIDALFSCTTCKECENACSAGVNVVDIIERSRAYINSILRDGEVRDLLMIDVHEKIAENVIKYGNPFGEEAERHSMLEISGKKEFGDVFYFTGCMAAYRTPEIANSTIKLLEASDVNYFLSQEEKCCGSVLIRTGRIKEAKEMAKRNLEIVKKSGAKTVVFTCAGCYRTFKEDYPKLVGELPFEVIHITEFLLSKDLPLQKEEKAVTYHDPCHLGRHLGIYEPPRELIRRTGAKIVEMKNNKVNAKCCGAGGGVRSAFKELSEAIGKRRVEEALKTSAKILLSACPFCVYHLRECSNGELEVKDISTYLTEHLKKNE
jgi:Fe-S oxidoreductase